ncbi:hypothetical protein G5B39_02595 [Rhodobacteraceae bacterium SC52]|nr:hypothetical protein G5B39_02595 [Rhodobacteraceae bacterium SC52]
MSSKDKTGRDDDKPEVDTEDHTANNPSLQDSSDGDDITDAQEGTDQPLESEDISDIEDAEIIGEVTADGGDVAAVEEALSEEPEFVGDDVTPTIDSTELEGDTAPTLLADDTADAEDDGLSDVSASQTGETEPSEPEPENVSPEPQEPIPPVAPIPAPAPEKSGGGGFVPAVFGGLIAAGLGFGAATMWGGNLMGDDEAVEQAIAQQADRLSGIESSLDTRLSELAAAVSAPQETDTSAQLTAIGDRLGEQVGSVVTQIEALSGTIETVQGGISDLEARLGALDTRLADVNERLSAVEKRPLTESSETAKQAFAAYERDLESLRAALDDQQSTNNQLAKELEDRAAVAQAEVDAAAQRAAELQQQAEEQARVAAEQAEARANRAAVREAIASLDASLKTGTGYANALQVLGENAEIPEPLAAAADDGIASLTQLRDSFAPLARDALDASRRETVDDGIADRLVSFLQVQSGVRSLDPREGDSPDAVLSRAEAALADGDLSTTLSELGKLPPSGQDAFADWTARAQEYLAVTEAADTLVNTLLAN